MPGPDGLPRTDSLPEHRTYTDEGCSVAPRCLACPLPQCRYDVAGGARTIRNAARDPQILAAHAAGASIDSLVAQFAVKRRTVFRVLRASQKDVSRAA